MLIKWNSWYERKQIHFDKTCDWHKYFAWYPIRVDRYSLAWLQYIERKNLKDNSVAPDIYVYRLNNG